MGSLEPGNGDWLQACSGSFWTHNTLYLRFGTLDFPQSSMVESTGNEGDPGSIPGLGRSPGRGHGNSLQYSCLENPHGQGSLVGYSPWGSQRDMTEQLSMAHLGAGSWKWD